MDRVEARGKSREMLSELLRTQPNLLQSNMSNSSTAEKGKHVSDFCINFIEGFATYLENREKTP